MARAISSTASVTRDSKRDSRSWKDRSITSTSTVTWAARMARAPTRRHWLTAATPSSDSATIRTTSSSVSSSSRT